MAVLLSLGHGYSAQALARRLVPAGWRVIGTVRRPEQAAALVAAGVEPLAWPGDLAPALAAASHVLSSVPPEAEGDPVLRAAGPALAATRHLAWVGYLSTTAVYGDHGGGLVDEATPPSPASARGRARVAAEAAWRATGLPLRIFRLAGIYGPGRGPFAKLRAGRAQSVVKPGQVFGRIHVEDIASVLAASMARPDSVAIYNVTDDLPAAPEAVLAHAAALLGLPAPAEVPFETAELSEMARSFYGENKRVRNDRIKRELGLRLAYPTYREGLAAVLAAEG